MDRRTSKNLTTLGNVLIGLGVAVWGAYALARWGLGWEVSVRQFLPFHLCGVIPGALLRHRPKRWRSDTTLLFLVVFFLADTPLAMAGKIGDGPFRVGGLLFGDFYYVPHHHIAEGDDALGAVLRRGFLTFDANFNDHWSARLRFEIHQSGQFETYTFDTDFKDLYVDWKPGRHLFRLGLSPTPTFDVIESFWHLRYLMRTPLDLQGVASRDTGIFAEGPLNSSGTLTYRAMLGAGLEFGNESGEGEKLMGAIGWRPTHYWTVDFYLDHEKLDGPTDRTTAQIFVGHNNVKLRWGAQYSYQDRQDDPRLELASAFAVLRLGFPSHLVGRIDRLMEPSPKGNDISYLPFDPSARATMFLLGLEYRISRHLRIAPNTVVTAYDRNSEGVIPPTDVYLRLTAYLDLE